MSSNLSFYRDSFLDKLGECRERASAALKQLDNCEVNLRVVTKQKDKDMPHCAGHLVRERSKSRCKESVEKVYRPVKCYSEYWDDSDSDCSCDERDGGCGGGRGRPPWCGPLCVDADGGAVQQNVNQQNISLIHGCCGRSGSKHRGCVHGKTKRCSGCSGHHSPPFVWTHGPGRRIGGRWPRQPHGRYCIHGYGPRQICSFCPSGRRQWLPSIVDQATNQYRLLENDDGSTSLINLGKSWKHIKEQAEAYQKQKKDEEDAKQKRIGDAMDLFMKLKAQYGGHPLLDNGSSYSTAGEEWDASGSRSAEDIRSEMAKINADLDQLHTRAVLDAQVGAIENEQEIYGTDLSNQAAMCSGALPCGEQTRNRIRGKANPLRSILIGGKKVVFADKIQTRTITEVNDTDDDADGSKKHACDCC